MSGDFKGVAKWCAFKAPSECLTNNYKGLHNYFVPIKMRIDAKSCGEESTLISCRM